MKKLYAWAILPGLLLALPLTAADDEKPKRQASPQGAKAYIVSPKDGATVKGKFKVIFGLEGMGICPAGITAEGIPIPDTGHHHLLVDTPKLPPMDMILPIELPNVLHFGKGQSETTLTLSPGKHTLQMVFADYAHVPHEPPVLSGKITITVE